MAELAESLGLAQPNVSDYERGILRLNADLILKLTRTLKVSADELLGLQQPKHGRSVRNGRLARRLQEIERLPRRDQEALLRTIDAFFRKLGKQLMSIFSSGPTRKGPRGEVLGTDALISWNCRSLDLSTGIGAIDGPATPSARSARSLARRSTGSQAQRPTRRARGHDGHRAKDDRDPIASHLDWNAAPRL